MGFRCLVRCSSGTDSEASSWRSLASSRDDYDWDAIHEERLKEEREERLKEERAERLEGLHRKNFLRAVLAACCFENLAATMFYRC